MKESSEWILVFIMIIVCLGILSITHNITTYSWKNEAVKEGHAEYYLDKEHNRQWRWLTVKKIEKK